MFTDILGCNLLITLACQKVQNDPNAKTKVTDRLFAQVWVSIRHYQTISLSDYPNKLFPKEKTAIIMSTA